MSRDAYIPSFKIDTPIFWCFSFFKECFNPQVRINKMIHKSTVDYHPSPSEFTSRIHPPIFVRDLSLQNISWNFLKPQTCISHHGCKKVSNLWCQDYWKVHFSQNLNLFIFHALRQNSPPCFYHQHFRQKEITHFPQRFLRIYFSPVERGRTMELKIWPKLNLLGYWS